MAAASGVTRRRRFFCARERPQSRARAARERREPCLLPSGGPAGASAGAAWPPPLAPEEAAEHEDEEQPEAEPDQFGLLNVVALRDGPSQGETGAAMGGEVSEGRAAARRRAEELTAPLSAKERRALRDLLAKIA